MLRVGSSIDFEAEGLLAGLDGEERESRVALLERLVDDGAGVEELRDAIDDGRLALLPLERMLAGRPALQLGGDLPSSPGSRSTSCKRQWRSIGLAVPNRDEIVMSKEDLAAANRMRAILDAGLAPSNWPSSAARSRSRCRSSPPPHGRWSGARSSATAGPRTRSPIASPRVPAG